MCVCVRVQEKRKKPDPPKPPNGQMAPISEESEQMAAEEEQHGDATLARTGRCTISLCTSHCIHL